MLPRFSAGTRPVSIVKQAQARRTNEIYETLSQILTVTHSDY